MKIFTFYINDMVLFKCPVPGPKGYCCEIRAVTKVILKVVVFWTHTSCGRVISYRRFEGSWCLYLQDPHEILWLLGSNLNYISFAYNTNNFWM